MKPSVRDILAPEPFGMGWLIALCGQ